MSEPALELTPELRAALVERLTALADDELILGHRNSEWTGHAPILEEDIAIANVAQDEIGHAILWYGLRQQLDGSDPDQLVYFRDAVDYRSSALVEQPRGDWAFTMLRQFLFDAYEDELLPRLAASSYAPIGEVAAKIRREELFHLRHSSLWLERLAHGTDESRRRLLAALDVLWPLLPQLLTALPGDAALAAAGIYPDTPELGVAVVARVSAALEGVGIAPPEPGKLTSYTAAGAAAREQRDDSLEALLAEMQAVARSDPHAEGW